MRCLSIIPLAVLAVAPLTRVTAQESPPVGVGDQVRFWTQQRRTVTSGTITGWAVDSFTVSDTWIPLTSVTRLEVRRRGSRGAKFAMGAVGGLVGGALFGAGLGALTCGEGGSGAVCTQEQGVAWGALAFGGVGLIVGSIYGLLANIDRWEEVPLDHVRVSFAPQRDGRFGLGLSVRF